VAAVGRGSRSAGANPHDPAAAFNLGLLLAEMGEHEQAEAALRAALRADPGHAPAAYNLAVLVGERDPAQAAALCRRAAEQRPQDPKYAFSRAYYEMRSGREREAVTTLEALVAAHPGYVDAVVLLGDLLVKQGRPRDAAALYDRALAIPGLPEDARATLGARRQALR
jgi:tetratricopeptide (TPR) repeat protein